MARIRSIKPEFWTDAKVVRLSPLARLMFVGAWNFADDYGCLPADAFQLKLRVLPMEPADADELVAELFNADLLEALRTPDAREFWHVTNWSKHQRVSKPSPSDWGLPTDWKHATTSTFVESPAPLPTHSESPPSGKERKGVEGSGTEGNGMELATLEAPRERNEVWDALSDIFGEPETKTARSLRGKVCKSLTEAGATTNEVHWRVQAWPTLYPDATLTDIALEKHWTALGRPPLRASEQDVEKHKWDLELDRAQAEFERKAIGQ